jgi:hypothetical protein
MKTKSLILALILLLLASSYIFAAPKLSYPASGALIPGQTKYDQVIALFGKPKDDNVSKTDQGLDKITYVESAGFIKGVLPMRLLDLYFKDGILVSYDWESNFKEDSTDFDETKVSQIKKGETTWQQAAEIIGVKYGEYTYPMTDSPDERALVFMFVQNRTEITGLFKAKAHIYTKSLTLTYGNDNIIKDISLEISGER